MINLQTYCTNGNYLEIILQQKENISDIPDTMFFKLLQKLKTKGHSCFQKQYKEFVYRNMFYENNDKNQIKIYKKHLTTTDNINNTMKLLVYHKEKLPYHVFPSTTMIHSISYVSKVIFKVNNRVYINFEKRTYDSDDKSNVSFNKIYINYNHDDNVDLTNIEIALNASIQLIQLNN